MVKFIDGYRATLCGKVFGKRGRELKLTTKQNGYTYFSKSKGYGNPNQTAVHRFVWEYFIGEIPDDMVVDHKNGVRSDARLCNLRLLSHADNVRAGKTSKISYSDVDDIRFMLSKGYNQTKVATLFGVSPQLICDIKKGRRWVKPTGFY